MADVAAQLGQRDEHLARIGDEVAVAAVAQLAAARISIAQICGRVGERQRLSVGKRLAGRGPRKNRRER